MVSYQKSHIDNKLPRIERQYQKVQREEREAVQALEQAMKNRLNKNGHYGISVERCHECDVDGTALYH